MTDQDLLKELNAELARWDDAVGAARALVTTTPDRTAAIQQYARTRYKLDADRDDRLQHVFGAWLTARNNAFIQARPPL